LKDDIEEYRRYLSSSETHVSSIKLFVKNSAAFVGLADTPTLILVEDKASGEFSLSSFGAEKQMRVTQLPEHAIVITGDGSLREIYHLGGRVQSRKAMRLLLTDNDEGGFIFSDAGIAAFKKDCEDSKRAFSLKGKEQYDGSHFAHLLEVYVDGKLRERLWIDSDRGYICIKEQIFLSNQSTEFLVKETLSENFVLNEHSQKWFPLKVTVESKLIFGEQSEYNVEVNIVPETLVINQPIPDSTFDFTVGEGMRVDDFRRDDNDKITPLTRQTY
jgi:hypothetical protein